MLPRVVVVVQETPTEEMVRVVLVVVLVLADMELMPEEVVVVLAQLGVVLQGLQRVAVEQVGQLKQGRMELTQVDLVMEVHLLEKVAMEETLLIITVEMGAEVQLEVP
jgi:hypothetical protein